MRNLYSKAQWEWVAARYKEGYTLVELGEFLGVHYTTVLHRMRAMNVKPPQYRPPLRKRASEFNALREE